MKPPENKRTSTPSHAPAEDADGLLAEIRWWRCRKESLERRAAAELEGVRARYQAIWECSYLLETLDRQLKGHLKRHRAEIFNGEDKRRLVNGAVYFGRETRLSIPKKALEVIKERGWREGLKVTETLNRVVVEKWPAERLEIIGARQKNVDKYSYDVERPA